MELKDFMKVYDSLEDRESKDIYEAQVMFRYTGDWRYIGNYNISNRSDWHDEYEYAYYSGWNTMQTVNGGNMSVWDIIRNNMKRQENRIYLFGAGGLGELIFKVLEMYKVSIQCFCDNKKSGGMHCGRSILSVEECVKESDETSVFIICHLNYNVREMMKKQLLEIGVKRERIVLGHEYCGRQYFEDDILKPDDKEIFVDCGSENAITCKLFANWVGNYKKIFTFEPNKDNILECKKNIKKYNLENTVLMPVGVWDTSAELSFVSNYGASKIDASGFEKIKVAPLDVLLDGEQVTFIKMDIEGSELRALQGAKKLIKECHPKLAICLYHNNEDFIEIPIYVKELNHDYKLYVRRYSSGSDEVVMYAV